MVTLPDSGELRAMRECPACGELYPAGQDCECGYCDHAGTPVGETCPICGGDVYPSAVDPVAELLDAADAMIIVAAAPFANADYWPAVDRLRAIVTRLQGTAGLSITAGGGA